MRQLHVVALSEDGRYLLLAPGQPAKESGKGAAAPPKAAFRVPLDARLTAAVRGELPRPGSTTAPASELTPKQIQARLRAGESVEEIARSAGVPAARVERFAGPVEGEKARVVQAAQAAVLTRARRGASAVSLGEAVAAHLVEVDVDPAEVVWNARRVDDGVWLVDASYTSRGRKKRSTWRYEPASGELTAADASSAVLGYVEPPDGRPATKVVAAKAPARRRTRSTPSAPTSRSAAAPRVPAAAKAPSSAAKRRATGGAARSTAAATSTAAPARGAAPSRARAGAGARSTTTVRAAAGSPAKAPAAAGSARTAPAAKGAAAKTPAAKTTTAKASAGKSSAAKTSAAKTTTAKAPAAKTPGVKAPAAKAATAKASAAKASAAKAPAAKAARADAPAAAKRSSVTRRRGAQPPAAARSRPPAASERPAEHPGPSGPPQLRVVPPPDDEPRTRASVPAWADVLLSTTPPSRSATPDEGQT